MTYSVEPSNLDATYRSRVPNELDLTLVIEVYPVKTEWTVVHITYLGPVRVKSHLR